MYVLTIVFLVSQVTISANFASGDDCEVAARRARAFDVGQQAVASATCAVLPASTTAPTAR